MREGTDSKTGGGQGRVADTVADTAADSDTGGDPPCWLNRVCDNCGRFIDDRDAVACPACGAHREPSTISIGLDDL